MTSINVPGAASAPIYRREAPLPTPEIGTGEAVTQAGKLVSEYAQQQDRVRQAMNQMIVARQKNIAAQQAAAEQQAEKERIAAEQQAEKERMNKARESQAKMDADDRREEKKLRAKLEEDKLQIMRDELAAKKAGGYFNWSPETGRASNRGAQPKLPTYPGFRGTEVRMLQQMEGKPIAEAKAIADSALAVKEAALANGEKELILAESLIGEAKSTENMERHSAAAERLRAAVEKARQEIKPYRSIASDYKALSAIDPTGTPTRSIGGSSTQQMQPPAQQPSAGGMF